MDKNLQNGQNWHKHRPIVFFRNVLPKWWICSLLLHISDTISAAIEKVLFSFTCIRVGQTLFSTSPQTLQSIWYPAPVFLQTPSLPKLCEGTKGLRWKVWTQTKILSPNIRLTKTFMAIFALAERLPTSATLLTAWQYLSYYKHQ